MSSGAYLGVCRCHDKHFCPDIRAREREALDEDRRMAKLGKLRCSWPSCTRFLPAQRGRFSFEKTFCEEEHRAMHICVTKRESKKINYCECGKHR